MTEFELASLITRIFIGAGQIAVVLDGISRMEKASVRRSQAGEQQHVETMAVLDLQRQALESLIARPEAGRPRDGKLTLEVDRFMGGRLVNCLVLERHSI